MILASDGIPILAHPPGDLVDPLLPELVRAGLRGLEVYRPSHKRHDMLRYERICRSRGLLMSGGSDWHTPDSGTALGDFFVEAAEIEKLLDTCDSATAGGKRDLAILVLLARLGLRASEVTNLEFDDVRWRSGEIVVNGKGDVVDRLPLLS